MSFPRVPFDTPYFDPTGLGFQPAKLTGLAWRAFTIVTICFDPQEREALFINADGYAVPLEPHPYELRRLLERASAHEYGQVCGAELRAHYHRSKAENDAVNAWLRGDASTPPLLQALAR